MKQLTIGAVCTGASAATREFHGGIAEIIVYNAPISSADRTTLENYLDNKWDLNY